MRVFIAVDIDNYNVISRISQIKNTIHTLNVPMKLVEDENLHITLLFIGEIPEDKVEALKQSIAEIKFHPIKLYLKGLGAFPNPARPRVVWVGVEGEVSALQELQKKVEMQTRIAGISFQSIKGFVPHLTIARIKGQRNIASLSKLILSSQEIEFGEQVITELKIKQSILTPKGPIYKDLYTVKSIQ